MNGIYANVLDRQSSDIVDMGGILTTFDTFGLLLLLLLFWLIIVSKLFKNDLELFKVTDTTGHYMWK